MQADLSFFESTGQAPSADQAGAIELNFLTAALAVSVAKAATVLTLAAPTAVFIAAASNDPVVEDDAYHWRYTVNHDANTFSADLSGRAQGTESLWEMRVSATGTNPPLSNFLWYSGSAMLNGTSGDWHIFDAATPGQSNELLSIEWTHQSATQWTLTFTNENDASLDLGDQLNYSVNGNIRSVSFLDASALTTATVQWDEVTHLGYIEAPNFNGGVRACWGATFENVTCSN
jgi:hypothetical protein